MDTYSVTTNNLTIQLAAPI